MASPFFDKLQFIGLIGGGRVCNPRQQQYVKLYVMYVLALSDYK